MYFGFACLNSTFHAVLYPSFPFVKVMPALYDTNFINVITVQQLCNYCATSVQYLSINSTADAHIVYSNCTVNTNLMQRVI